MLDEIKQFGTKFVEEWSGFIKDEQLNRNQAKQLLDYLLFLRQENEKINITTIKDPIDIVTYHFRDSLQLRDFIPLNKSMGIADIGTGGGFPGIPLKILFPDLPVTLIEVNQKKVGFLRSVIQQLNLKQIEVVDLDWRTFLRKTEYSIDLFTARASLQPEELIRLFKPSCFYKQAKLVYWASNGWKPGKEVEPFTRKEHPYKVGSKKRKLVLLSGL